MLNVNFPRNCLPHSQNAFIQLDKYSKFILFLFLYLIILSQLNSWRNTVNDEVKGRRKKAAMVYRTAKGCSLNREFTIPIIQT